jgi:tetratricopeptide (TPR) repeat protein
MDRVATAFQYGRIALNQGEPFLAINHFTEALEVFHSAVGSDYNRIFWANILFARAEAYLVCQQYHLVEMDIKQALNDCPQQLYDLVSFMTYIYFHSHTVLQGK